MRINLTIAYGICEFIISVRNLLHVSATFCEHLQGGVLRRMCYKRTHSQCVNIKYLLLNIRSNIQGGPKVGLHKFFFFTGILNDGRELKYRKNLT